MDTIRFPRPPIKKSRGNGNQHVALRALTHVLTPNVISGRSARGFTVPLLATLLGACAGNGQGLDANGNPTGSNDVPEAALTADFKSIQDHVFTPICVRCHSGAAAPQGLQLDAAHSYALLVGVSSAEQPALDRVSAGDPDHSYLILKLEGAAGIVGAQMPFGGPYLPQATIDVIRQWISDGAQPAATAGAASAATDAFAVSTTSPADGAHAHTGLRQLVVAFNHEPDATLLNPMTLHVERLTDAGAQELPGSVTLRLARGNPAAVLITPRAALTPGRYRLSVGAAGASALADVNAQPLAAARQIEFIIEDAP
jgi:Bacterial Ig-like domain